MKIPDILNLSSVQTVREMAERADRTAYLVGGTVRDALLKRKVKDIDVVISGDIRNWIQRLAQKLGTRVVAMGKENFLTYRLPLKTHHLDVWELGKSTLEEDAWRRDFTVNSLYYDMDGNRLIDFTQGRADLKKRQIRMLTLNAMESDPVRMLRAVRFKVTLNGFAIERATFRTIRECRHLISKMPSERISAELDMILSGSCPYEGLILLDETGLLDEILPEFTAMKGVEQNAFHPDDVFHHTLNCVNQMGEVLAMGTALMDGRGLDEADKLILISSLLLHDIGKPTCKAMDDEGMVHFYNHEKISAMIAESMGKRLRWSRHRCERVSRIVRHHTQPMQLSLAGCPEKGIRRLIHRMGDDLPLLVLHFLADRLSKGEDDMVLPTAKRLMDVYETCRHQVVQPKKLVTGKDVMNILEIRPGPEIGKVLSSITRRQVEGEIHTRQEALRVLKNLQKRQDKRESNRNRKEKQ